MQQDSRADALPDPLASQEFTELVFNNPPPAESEDCLYLNVYAPSTPAPADGRAVLFWIYGGGLQFGNAGQHYYDGSWFACKASPKPKSVLPYPRITFGLPGTFVDIPSHDSI